ncbi:MAG: PD-(D/E)XK nuclease family protein, partial [Thermomicrobia bacterium]|nr:PD-(D/E)XK nuclease family protein [Thermomicrobia bacterium]
MMTDEFSAERPDGALRLSPTDISQFIRLDQCERYLRLRLHERGVNANFLRQYGVAPVSVTPLLTRSGATFEEQVTAVIDTHYATRDFAKEHGDSGARPENNRAVIAEARALPAGCTRVLFQPRLTVVLDGWQIRGDVDILRLERDADGLLRVMIADMKSSTSAKVEHRLQVAFYAEMLDALFAADSVACEAIDIAVLYRGPADGGDGSPEAAAQQVAAQTYFGGDVGLLEIVAKECAADYRRSVRDLVTGPGSTARRVIAAPFDAVPFHLTAKCDSCLYNEFCMKRSVERDDLSLLPHLTMNEKSALHSAGVATVGELAAVKEPAGADTPAHLSELVAAPGKAALATQLAGTWPVGPRVDELIHRARGYRRSQGDQIAALGYIPSKGYGSLPYADAQQNPNLIRVYIDAQHDYLHDRIYLIGALIVACERGEEVAHRRRSIVHMTAGPPDTTAKEEALFLRWIDETLRALVAVAAPDADGARRAPIHLIFNDSQEQRLLLDGLARHLGAIFGATPCYDFVTQIAAFDSPIATYLDQEIRELKNYPIVCQSLQAVASLTRFDWNAGTPYRDLFRARLFDARGKLEPDDESARWYTRRARFNSRIPLEYAYAAWGELAPPAPGKRDEFAPYRAVTTDDLRGFQGRRLEAMEHVAKQFKGNMQTAKRPFDLPDLATFSEKARSRAHAIDEFVMIERHVDLGAWKAAHLAPPERRVLTGETLLVRYRAGAQSPEAAAANADNRTHAEKAAGYEADYLRANPDAARAELTKEQRKET